MEILPENYDVSTFFTEDGIIFGKGDLIINITARNIIYNLGLSYRAPSNIGLRDGNFQPDDIEVLVAGGKECFLRMYVIDSGRKQPLKICQ